MVVVDCSDHLELQLRTADPLASPVVLDHVQIIDDLVLHLGIDESGASLTVPLVNKSGVVVGGLPGSGKTAWLTAAFGSLSPSPFVQMSVTDGKGGHDLDSLRCRCYRFHGADATLVEIRDTLRDIELVVQQRRRVMPDLFGTSNFWSAPLSSTNPVLLVLIDEVQQLLPAAFSAKDDKQIASEIETILKSLVRLGRSAGCVVVLSTQRPTADAIPTAIRDNAEVRICFNVRNRDSAVAVLGELTSEDAVSPVGLPQGVGVSFVDDALRKFRAPFVAEAVVAEFVRRHQSLTADPLDLLSRALADVPDHVPDQAGR
ncbi:AAA family ATPase [Mycobacteroides abscessus]|uniref:AAA family ATPase n=1 Tax=Mycobacteroides abscessus TaxID=36809 RepID=UPI000941346A|nr:AAA family ATPase [Mycobacteroides abscessus]